MLYRHGWGGDLRRTTPEGNVAGPRSIAAVPLNGNQDSPGRRVGPYCQPN
jgi:hypothetical protein